MSDHRMVPHDYIPKGRRSGVGVVTVVIFVLTMLGAIVMAVSLFEA